MDKSKIQKVLTESQIKEIRKIAAETAEIIVNERLNAIFTNNKSKVLKKKGEEAAKSIQNRIEKERGR